MRITTLFYDLPMWAIYIVTVLVILLSAEAGYRVGNWRSRSGSREKEAPIGGLVGATLGLLAFLLAFTFSGAATRFDARRQMVLQEANALGKLICGPTCCPSPNALRRARRWSPTPRCAPGG